MSNPRPPYTYTPLLQSTHLDQSIISAFDAPVNVNISQDSDLEHEDDSGRTAQKPQRPPVDLLPKPKSGYGVDMIGDKTNTKKGKLKTSTAKNSSWNQSKTKLRVPNDQIEIDNMVQFLTGIFTPKSPINPRTKESTGATHNNSDFNEAVTAPPDPNHHIPWTPITTLINHNYYSQFDLDKNLNETKNASPNLQPCSNLGPNPSTVSMSDVLAAMDGITPALDSDSGDGSDELNILGQREAELFKEMLRLQSENKTQIDYDRSQIAQLYNKNEVVSTTDLDISQGKSLAEPGMYDQKEYRLADQQLFQQPHQQLDHQNYQPPSQLNQQRIILHQDQKRYHHDQLTLLKIINTPSSNPNDSKTDSSCIRDTTVANYTKPSQTNHHYQNNPNFLTLNDILMTQITLNTIAMDPKSGHGLKFTTAMPIGVAINDSNPVETTPTIPPHLPLVPPLLSNHPTPPSPVYIHLRIDIKPLNLTSITYINANIDIISFLFRSLGGINFFPTAFYSGLFPWLPPEIRAVYHDLYSNNGENGSDSDDNHADEDGESDGDDNSTLANDRTEACNPDQISPSLLYLSQLPLSPVNIYIKSPHLVNNKPVLVLPRHQDPPPNPSNEYQINPYSTKLLAWMNPRAKCVPLRFATCNRDYDQLMHWTGKTTISGLPLATALTSTYTSTDSTTGKTNNSSGRMRPYEYQIEIDWM